MAKQFPDFKAKEAGLKKILDKLPHQAGVIAVEHIEKNFRTQAWNGATPSKWAPRKPSKKKRDTGRAILVDKGTLRGSWDHEVRGPLEVAIGTDVTYAEVHNEGKRAGRGKGFQMPKRQMAGPSPEIDRRIEKVLDKEMDKLFG